MDIIVRILICSIILIITSCNLSNKNTLEFEEIELTNEIVNGRKLFETHCQNCHSKNLREMYYGPALGNITYFRDSSWLVNFTKNSEQALFDSTDHISMILWNSWAPTLMGNFDTILSDEEINQVYKFIEYESLKQKIGLREVEFVSKQITREIDDDNHRLIFGIFVNEISNIRNTTFYQFTNKGFENIKRILYYEYDIQYPSRESNYFPMDQNDDFQSFQYKLIDKKFDEKVIFIFDTKDNTLTRLDEIHENIWEYTIAPNQKIKSNLFLIGLARKKEVLFGKKVLLHKDKNLKLKKIELEKIGFIDDFLEFNK